MKVADQEKHVTAGKARTRWDLPATGRACARWGSPVADGAHAWRSTRLWLVVLAPGKAHPGSVVSAANNGARAPRTVGLARGRRHTRLADLACSHCRPRLAKPARGGPR
jgi:hypothetical protein